ncbi:MAG: hypothetical protein ABEJ07_05815 [Candidatus Nanohaloarchaea archaeon]
MTVFEEFSGDEEEFFSNLSIDSQIQDTVSYDPNIDGTGRDMTYGFAD